jgi:predicted secreted protein
MTTAIIGYTTKYSIMGAQTPTPSYVDIAEVISITPGDATADRVEATHMNSPGKRREYIAGMIDSGEATFEINWVPGSATDVFLRDLFTSGATRSHRIEFPNGVTVTFNASIIGFSKAVPIDDRMTATITVAVSGEETWSTLA